MTLFDLAQRFVGEVREIPGERNDPFIQWCLASCGFDSETPDEVPWCSAFLNRLAWLLRLPRSKSAAALSWLSVGLPVDPNVAQIGDVVVLSRGEPPAGHVGLYAGFENDYLMVLGGNQSNSVTVAPFDFDRVLGVRRLA